MAESNYTDIGVEQFRNLMQEPGNVVLDVRTDAETAAGVIPGALCGFDMYNGDFENRFPGLDKSACYLLYCRSGVRSAHACELMAAAGFKQLYNLRGGILAWAQSAF